jgi:hypothetical protein
MRLLTTAGVVVFAAGTAFGAYVVDLDGGDRMTVDSYWEEAGRIHLMRGGVDLNVPKSRVRSIKPTSDADDDTSGFGQTPQPAPEEVAPTGPTGSAQPADDQDLEARQRGIEEHMLKIQRERFEAASRGDSEKELKRLDREFKRTQERRREVLKARAASAD